MLKFDLSNIPSGAQISSANLSLFLTARNGAIPGEVCSVFVLTKDWEPKEVTWLEAKKDDPWASEFEGKLDIVKGGGDYTQKYRATLPAGGLNKWEVYNVKEAVQEMINNPGSSFGFLMQPQVENKGRYYVSSKNDSLTKRPKLALTYTESAVRFSQKSSTANKSLRIDQKGNELRIFVALDKSYEVSIVNAFGERVYWSDNSQPQWFTVPTGAFAKGMYLVSVKHATGIAATRYFITD